MDCKDTKSFFWIQHGWHVRNALAFIRERCHMTRLTAGRPIAWLLPFIPTVFLRCSTNALFRPPTCLLAWVSLCVRLALFTGLRKAGTTSRIILPSNVTAPVHHYFPHTCNMALHQPTAKIERENKVKAVICKSTLPRRVTQTLTICSIRLQPHLTPRQAARADVTRRITNAHSPLATPCVAARDRKARRARQARNRALEPNNSPAPR